MVIPLAAQPTGVSKMLAIGIWLMLTVTIAGCFSSREQDAEEAEAAAARSQASAERAEAAADKALQSSAAAMKAADHAAAAVKEATKEMDRVSAHLEQLLKEREEMEAEDDDVKPPRRKPAASATPVASGDASGNREAAAVPVAKPSPAN